jgi:hypothetical protein
MRVPARTAAPRPLNSPPIVAGRAARTAVHQPRSSLPIVAVAVAPTAAHRPPSPPIVATPFQALIAAAPRPANRAVVVRPAGALPARRLEAVVAGSAAVALVAEAEEAAAADGEDRRADRVLELPCIQSFLREETI